MGNILLGLSFAGLSFVAVYLLRRLMDAQADNDRLLVQIGKYAQQVDEKRREIQHLQDALGAAQYYCEQADEKLEEITTPRPVVFYASRKWLIGPFGRN